MKATTTWEELEDNMRRYYAEHPEVASGEQEMSAEDSEALDKIIEQVWNAQPLF